MSLHYFDTVTSERQYTKNAVGAQPLSKLEVTSGSRWGAEQLEACHVVVDSKAKDHLPLLNNYVRTIRETFKPGNENAQIAAFIKGLDPNHRTMRQHALIREPEGGKEQLDPRKRTSGRVRSQTTYPGYVSSEVIASSSQGHEDTPSSSLDAVTDSYTSVQGLAAHLPVESYTVELAFAAINHILLYTQNPSLKTPVEIRQPERHCIQVEDKLITALDDGGLTFISSEGERTKTSLVLIEAKRRLDVCPKTHRPFVSDERLGQMTCEAIAARSCREEDNGGDDIFIINTIQHYMCFFHFIVTPNHLKDIKDGKIPSMAIKVTATRWFNLERQPDRKCIVENVLQLAEHMRQKKGRPIAFGK